MIAKIKNEEMKIMVVGSQGNMGRLLCQFLPKQKCIKSVIEVSRSDNLSERIESTHPDILIELTNKDSVMANCLKSAEQKIPLIVGASGLSKENVNHLDDLCRKNKIPCLVVPNFSLASVLMLQAAKTVAKYLTDCEIIEYHHENKKDAPSATSLHTARVISGCFGGENKSKKIAQTVGMVENHIPIHSVRSKGVLAKQDVIFAQKGESLTISLSQIDRQAFMPGVLMSIKGLKSLSFGVHVGLEHVLEKDILN